MSDVVFGIPPEVLLTRGIRKFSFAGSIFPFLSHSFGSLSGYV